MKTKILPLVLLSLSPFLFSCDRAEEAANTPAEKPGEGLKVSEASRDAGASRDAAEAPGKLNLEKAEALGDAITTTAKELKEGAIDLTEEITGDAEELTDEAKEANEDAKKQLEDVLQKAVSPE